MPVSPRQLADRVLAPVPAYLLIISGMTLLGLALLMPAWIKARELAWQKSVMTVQAQRLEEQEQAYRQFNEALASDDPVLLERLAYYHLRLKPAGSTPLSARPAIVNANNRTANRAASRAAGPETRIPTIDEMLRRPVPRPGVDTPAYEPVRTRLVVLTTGPLRLVVIAGGIFCLVAGLTSPVPGLVEIPGMPKRSQWQESQVGERRADTATLTPPVQSLSSGVSPFDPSAAGATVVDEDADEEIAQDKEVVGELDTETEIFDPLARVDPRFFDPLRDRVKSLAGKLRLRGLRGGGDA